MALKPVQVSQLNGYIKRILQTDPILGNVSVIGEISNLKYHNNGHVYLTLKDETSKINCFLPMEYVKTLHYELVDGMEVTVSGSITVYDRGGTYSLLIRDMTVEGVGNLSVAFERMKKKLEEEGLFSGAHKKELPFFPRKIAIVTSPTGAAIRDVIKIITSRNRYVHILVYPCLVQGPDAAGQIASAITHINEKFPETDVMIVGRGGGSMEELWPFNEEIVARSIFASAIPVISAVGHETDVTIADFVADFRAETPTAAAQKAVPDLLELKSYCNSKLESLRMNLHRRVDYLERTIRQYEKSELLHLLRNRWELYHLYVKGAKERLDAYNPVEIMSRGYGILTDGDGRVLSGVNDVQVGTSISVLLPDGSLHCQVQEITIMDRLKNRKETRK